MLYKEYISMIRWSRILFFISLCFGVFLYSYFKGGITSFELAVSLAITLFLNIAIIFSIINHRTNFTFSQVIWGLFGYFVEYNMDDGSIPDWENPATPTVTAVRLEKWCLENCQDEVLRIKRKGFIFRNQEDAILFRMVW